MKRFHLASALSPELDLESSWPWGRSHSSLSSTSAVASGLYPFI